MPASDYIKGLRSHIGTEFLLLPGVTAVIADADRFLLARQRDSRRWSLIGGGIEPGEQPETAVRREVREELGVEAITHGIVGVYGGAALETVYPNGDRVGYVTVAYRCSLFAADLTLDSSELLEVRWVTTNEIRTMDRHGWIDEVIADATR
ncbi:8-oxo-dGTP pyrophosphatase MutT (NUDIX family) [Microbacterium terrae]|uniref:Nucleoside triphosphatase NudI n=1 Tax=Microbacterium terrae TaxID=69369 RepID=A0A0M2H2U1_9MICO|nr:NUDIX domain-containing protein [Microbacterium terrae]KJL37754.1 Nucleoside triphosphatase NudI [Microbacterium terrae]MBP1076586.1 8-oxo-dGTP pyrophosphatase MutT (NUDIX family) [Microbacterium terrae]GLJ97414.1 NUDIX hydrolase [Microbacterium terrae]